MKPFLLFTLFCFTMLLQAQDKKHFDKLLKENNISFKIPSGYKETPVIDNPDFSYNYAIALAKDSFEVRYTIFPLSNLIAEYETSLSDPALSPVDPNKYHESMYMASILNISQLGAGKMPTSKEMHGGVAEIEFGADYAVTSLFETNSDFANGYKHCFFLLIHKKNVADVYISFLSNDEEKIQEQLLNVFKSLHFNEVKE